MTEHSSLDIHVETIESSATLAHAITPPSLHICARSAQGGRVVPPVVDLVASSKHRLVCDKALVALGRVAAFAFGALTAA